MNPPPLSRLTSDPSPTSSTPAKSQSTASPASPAQPVRASPRLLRQAEKGTPRTSKLGQEVFSASAEVEDRDDGDGDKGEKMEVDDEA